MLNFNSFDGSYLGILWTERWEKGSDTFHLFEHSWAAGMTWKPCMGHGESDQGTSPDPAQLPHFTKMFLTKYFWYESIFI